MVKLRLITFLCALVVASPAMAGAFTQPLNEHHWWGQGTCNGNDAVVILESGFETVPIYIVKTTVVFQPDSPVNPSSYVFSGDSDRAADILVWAQPSASGTAFTQSGSAPAGTSMVMNPGEHVDLHVSCYPAGIHFQVYLIVYYLK